MIPNRPTSPFYTEDHLAYADTVRRFVENEIEPNIDAWEDARVMPRSLWKKAAEIGMIGVHYPEEYLSLIHI